MALKLTLTLAAVLIMCSRPRLVPRRLEPDVHPFLAYKDIDWDGAPIRAIPHVRGAETPVAYLTAINAMLELMIDSRPPRL